MRTLKKSLALVLVVAMAVSLLSVGAFASSSTFTDSSKVGATYAEAVDLLSGIGVVSGTTSTTLEPTGNYTREQAAKVVCYLTLGKTASDALVTGAAPFKDVAADRWSAGFIAYCSSQGIINGNGDGTFNPTSALTGYAWAKMLLTALGNGQSGEYTGASWQIAVAKDALPLGIFKNDTAAATSATISRQQAMLLGYNALFLPTTSVSYTWDNGVKHVSATNKTGNSFAYSIYSYLGQSDSALATPAKPYFGISNTSATSSCLARVKTIINGSEGYKWYYKSTTTPVTGFYTDETVIGTNTSGKSLSNQTTYNTSNTYFTAKVDNTTKYFLNGAAVDAGTKATGFALSGVTYYTNSDCTTVATGLTVGTSDVSALYTFTAFTTAAAKVGAGTSVTYVDTNNDNTTAEKVYVSNYSVGVLKAAPVTYTGTADGKTYIYINMKVGTPIGVASGTTTGLVLASDVTGYSGLVAGDVVTVTTNATGYVLAKAATFTGAASASTATTLTVGGTVYTASSNADSSTFKQGFLNNVAFYTDAYGYLVYAAAVTAATTNYLYVMDNNTYVASSFTGTPNQSFVAFDDGTTATITVTSKDAYNFANDGVKTMPTKYTAYAYSKNTDGTYALSSPSTVKSSAAATSANSDGTITNGVASISSASNGSIKVDSNTKFVYRSIKTSPSPITGTTYTLPYDASTNSTGTVYNSTWTAYTGYANALTSTAAYYSAALDSNSYADVVFVYEYSTIATTAKSAIFLLGVTPTVVYKTSYSVDYYTFPAIVDGVKTTVKATIGDITGAGLDLFGVGSDFGNAYAAKGGTPVALTAGTLCSVQYSNGYLDKGSVTPINSASLAMALALAKGAAAKAVTDAGGSASAATAAAAAVTNTVMSRSFVYADKSTGGILAPSNGSITIGGTDYSYGASTYVFYISADQSTMTMGTVDAVSDNKSATVTAVTNAASILSTTPTATTTAAQENSLYAIFIQLT